MESVEEQVASWLISLAEKVVTDHNLHGDILSRDTVTLAIKCLATLERLDALPSKS